jgi:hypothetical protein
MHKLWPNYALHGNDWELLLFGRIYESAIQETSTPGVVMVAKGSAMPFRWNLNCLAGRFAIKISLLTELPGGIDPPTIAVDAVAA